jgi:hypothetical protein
VFFECESYLAAPFTTIRTADETSIEIVEDNLFNSTSWTDFSTKLAASTVAKSTSGMAVYSENIYTRMDDVNSLLNAFGVNSNFSNSVLVDAYRNYLTNTDHGADNFLDDQGKFIRQDGDFGKLNDVLASNVYLPAVTSNPGDLLKLSGGETAITDDGGLSTLSYNAWKNSKLIDSN